MKKFETHNELKNVILVSDIHANWEALKKITQLPEYNKNDYRIIFLGDYTDWNGKNVHDPIKVINFIMNQVTKHGALAIHGNHDDMLYGTALGDFQEFYNWGYNGILGTQKLLGLTPNNINLELTKNELNTKYYKYIDFLDSIPYGIEDKNRLFVHAGVDWSKKDYHDTSKENLTWIREDYFYNQEEEGTDPSTKYKGNNSISPIWHENNTKKVIVAGHTPTYLFSGKINNPIISIKNNQNDIPRYDIDGGSHSGIPEAALNILILNKDGNELKRYRLS